MLNKLRLKFVGISLTLFGIVLIIFFTVSYKNAENRVEKNAISILKQLSENYGRQTTVYHMKTNLIFPSNFTLFLDENHQIISALTVSNPINYAGDNTELLQKLVNVALETNEHGGIITINQNTSLRYLIVNQNNNLRITFLSRTSELLELEASRQTATHNTFYLMIILLGTSILLSIWTFKPVKHALDQQNQFLADASHELKTPLTAIQANLDVVLASPDKTISQQSKWMNYIKDELVRVKTLSNDLLFLAKNESKEITQYYTNINFSQLVSSSVLSLESLAFESQKTFDLKLKQNIYTHGNEDRLKQLMMILIDNAIKYAPDLTEIHITLKTNNNKIIFSVTNDVDEIVDTNKIFHRFYREDRSRNRKSGGNGLGLAIAQTIIEDHRGKIIAKNQHNQLIITCVLPLAKRPNA